MLKLFTRHRQPEPPEPKFPNDLNPCKCPEKHTRERKAYYGVQGRVTTLCIDCYFDAKKKYKEGWEYCFKPDLSGVCCK